MYERFPFIFFFRFTLKFQKIENENAKYYLILIWQISEYDKELHAEASFIIEVVNGHWWNINGSNLFEFILSIVFIQIKNRDYWTEIPHTHTHTNSIQTCTLHGMYVSINTLSVRSVWHVITWKMHSKNEMKFKDDLTRLPLILCITNIK